MISWQNSINITVRALVVCEPCREGEKIRGLIIELLKGAKLEKINSSFLHIEECENLLKAIGYMIGLIDKFKTMNRKYTEVTFSTKDKFKVGFYQKGITFTAFVSSGYISDSTCFLPVESLPDLKAIIDQAISMAKK